MLEIRRLHLASLTVGTGERWPVHGFVVRDSNRAVLVDTGVGGPDEALAEWRVVNRTVGEALADIDMTPGDIELVINTHLHFDHCGQNAVFKHAACWVQRNELARAKREEPELADWFDWMNARFELLDGDTEVLPGLRVITTPGHTAGHQSVLVETGDNSLDVLIGDAVYTTVQFSGPPDDELPPGQAADPVAWRGSLDRVRGLGAAQVHFCHDIQVLHG